MDKTINNLNRFENEMKENIEDTHSIGTQCMPTRNVYYSAPTRFIDERLLDTYGACNSEGDVNNDLNASIGSSDSEITVLRLKMESSHLKSIENNCHFIDSAISGDGNHLGRSASLVNLATYIVRNKPSPKASAFAEKDEYLIPLSSWDGDKPNEFTLQLDAESITCRRLSDTRVSCYEYDLIEEQLVSSELQISKLQQQRPKRLGFARKFTKFIKKHCPKKFKWNSDCKTNGEI